MVLSVEEITFDRLPPQNRDRGLLVGDSLDMVGAVGVDPDDRRLLEVLVTQTVPPLPGRNLLNNDRLEQDAVDFLQHVATGSKAFEESQFSSEQD